MKSYCLKILKIAVIFASIMLSIAILRTHFGLIEGFGSSSSGKCGVDMKKFNSTLSEYMKFMNELNGQCSSMECPGTSASLENQYIETQDVNEGDKELLENGASCISGAQCLSAWCHTYPDGPKCKAQDNGLDIEYIK
jgi:hypothetical protein